MKGYLQKSILLLSTICLINNQANALNYCADNDIVSFLQGYAQGQSVDPTLTDTLCYKQYTKLGSYIQNIATSLQHFELSNVYFETFFNNIINYAVQQSDLMEVCQELNKIKQLDNRVTSMSGFSQMLFTIFYSYFTKGDVYYSINNLKSFQSLDCTMVGQNIGLLIVSILQTKTAVSVFLNEFSTFNTASTFETIGDSNTNTNR
eukprot:403374050